MSLSSPFPAVWRRGDDAPKDSQRAKALAHLCARDQLDLSWNVPLTLFLLLSTVNYFLILDQKTQ